MYLNGQQLSDKKWLIGWILQGGPAKVKPSYFTHQNAQTRYYSTVLFYKKTGSYSQKYYKRKG